MKVRRISLAAVFGAGMLALATPPVRSAETPVTEHEAHAIGVDAYLYFYPLVMLTGHDTDTDTILGLESGANDYVAKPFRFAVLLARIRAPPRATRSG